MSMTMTEAKLNGIDTQAMQEMMDRVRRHPDQGTATFKVQTRWMHGTQSESKIDGWELGGQKRAKRYTLRIDEPEELLGTNMAANPQEYLLAAMNACLMATYVGACSMQGIELEHLEIESQGTLDLRGFLGLDRSVSPGYDDIHYKVRIRGNGTAAQYRYIHNWVMQTSPNYWNMANPVRMHPELIIDNPSSHCSSH